MFGLSISENFVLVKMRWKCKHDLVIAHESDVEKLSCFHLDFNILEIILQLL